MPLRAYSSANAHAAGHTWEYVSNAHAVDHTWEYYITSTYTLLP